MTIIYSVKECLYDIDTHIKNARRRLGSLSCEDFIIDDDKIDLVRISLQDAPEAVRRINRSAQKTMRKFMVDYPKVKWDAILQTSNDSRHGYDSLDPRRFWDDLQPRGPFTLLEKVVLKEIDYLQKPLAERESVRENTPENQKKQHGSDLLPMSDIAAQCFDDILTDIESARSYLHSLSEEEFCENEKNELQRLAVRCSIQDASKAARRLNQLDPDMMKAVEQKYKGINWKGLRDFSDDGRPHYDTVYFYKLCEALGPNGYATLVEEAMRKELGHRQIEVKRGAENAFIKPEKQGRASRRPNSDSGSGRKR